MKSPFLLFTALFLTAAAAQPALENPINYFQDKQTQRAEATLNTDMDVLGNLYAEEIIDMSSYQPAIHGRDALLESTADDLAAAGALEELTYTTVDVFGDGDYYYEIGTYILSINMPGIPEPVNDHGKYLVVWEEAGDDWKIKAHMWNTDVNMFQ